jgi:hypothetical protein
MPINVNYGVTPAMEIYATFPFLYNKVDIISDNDVSKSSDSGVGDVSLGLRYRLISESSKSPSVTASLDIITPTGETADLTDVSGVSTGSGFWGFSTGLFVSKSIDPAIVFINFGYQYTYDDDRDGENIQPGEILVYGFGTGLTVNNSVAFSGRVTGSYQKEFKRNKQLVQGSTSEPISFVGSMSYRLGDNTRLETSLSLGATEDAKDIVMGFTYIWNF